MKVDLFSVGPFTVHGYGLMIGIGVLCCIFMGMRRAKKYGMSEDAVIDIALFGLLAGFLGAKVLYVIVEFEAFVRDPLSVLGSEGFVVYGGISAGVAAAIVYCRIKKHVFLEYFDLLAPCIALAQGFGRMGCFSGRLLLWQGDRESICHRVPGVRVRSQQYSPYPDSAHIQRV